MARRLAISRRMRILSDMETIAAVAEIAEAQLIRSVLEGHGIQAEIPDEQTAGVAPHYIWASGGITVKVAEKDVVEAKAILASQTQGAAEAIEREQNENTA